MYGVYKKIMEERNPSDVLELIKFCTTQVKTNLSVKELYDLAMEVLTEENLLMQQTSIPKDGTYEATTYEGMQVLEIKLKANKEYLKELLY